MKRIVICCDGTWQRPLQNWVGEASPTNVVRMAARVAKRDGDTPQIIYYDQGVGTGDLFDAIAGGLVGAGLDQNIFEAYRFLVANYLPGDELYLFGFSRGAYTVRSLAGMIRKCGIVRRDRVLNEGTAIDLYRDEQKPDDPGPCAYRRDSSITGSEPVPIKFIGVWDTVGALGIPGSTSKRYAFHDTKLSGTVEHAYQALAVDERRKAFTPTIWTSARKDQKLEQVWFCGSHSDVGGGIASKGLPAITLEWMCDKARQAGLALDSDVQAAYPLQPDVLARFNFIERSSIWRLLAGIKERGVGVDEAGVVDLTQSLHPSVLQRWDTAGSYRPANLRAYLLLTGDRRGPQSRSGALQPA